MNLQRTLLANLNELMEHYTKRKAVRCKCLQRTAF